MRLRETQPETGSVWPRGHGGPSRTVSWAGYEFVLNAGSGDWLYFYQDLDDRDSLYALTVGRSMGYIGLERFSAEDPEPEPARDPDQPELQLHRASFDIFSQSPDDDTKPDGLSLLEMAPYNAIRYLSQWEM